MSSLKINNQSIPWSFYWWTVKKLGLEGADQAFFKCRDKARIIPYMRKGMKEGWLGQSTKEMDYNKAYMNSWIEKNIPKPSRKEIDKKIKPQTKKGVKAKVEGIGDILGDLGIN